MAKILVVEDDEMVAEAVIDSLKLENHTADWTADGQEGLDRLLFYQYDLAILDWNLPGMAGTEVCKQYRTRGGNIPVILLTGKSNVANRVEGLDSGADDYLTKPFSVHELAARVRALLRRPPTSLTQVLTVGGLALDSKLGKVTLAGKDIALLPKELALLEFLMRHKGQIYNVGDLLNHIWSSESESTEDAVRQCIARLRKKLDGDSDTSLIVTVKGLGYKIDEPG